MAGKIAAEDETATARTLKRWRGLEGAIAPDWKRQGRTNARSGVGMAQRAFAADDRLPASLIDSDFLEP